MNVEAKPIRLSNAGKFIAIAIIVALAILLFRAVGHVMTPFIAAAITAYLFNPLITWLNRRTRITRAVWILVLYVLLGGLMYWGVRSLGPIVIDQYDDLRSQIPTVVSDVSRELSANQTIEFGGLVFDLGPIEAPILDLLSEAGRALSSNVPHLFAMAIETLLLFITYLIITFYMMLQADQIMNWLYGLVPAPYRAEIRGLGAQVDDILASYVRGTLLLIPIMSILTYIALSLLQVRYALVIAIATGFLEVIPLIGPWSAAGIAMTVAFFQPTTPFGWDSWVLVAVVGITYFVLRVSEDSFIIPHVVGHAVHLHPILVMFAILSGGVLGGAFGLLISIPVVAIVRLLLRYIYRKLVDAPDLPPSDVLPPNKAPQPAPKTVEAPNTSPSPRPSQSMEAP